MEGKVVKEGRRGLAGKEERQGLLRQGCKMVGEVLIAWRERERNLKIIR